MQIISYLAVAMLVGLVSLPSYAHEFWMEPSDFQPQVGDVVTVDLVIGTHFDLTALPKLCLAKFLVKLNRFPIFSTKLKG